MSLPRLTIAWVGSAVLAASGSGPLVPADEPSRLAPSQLVRQAVQNEVASNTNSGRHFMFKDHRKTVHLSQTKLLVETRDAMAGMIIAQDGRPLSPQERERELARLENYIRNPAELEKKRKQEKEDTDRTERILRALPDALLYQADGTEAGSAAVGRAGDELVRLKFRPNPDYNPPTRVEQVLTGMEGTLLIDAREMRVAAINATLEKDVGFGWGILGHLDRGGQFLVQQADVGDRDWEVTRMELAFTGKILLIKKLNIRSSDIFSDFRPVPSNLTFAQGVDLLKKHLAEDHAADLQPGNKMRGRTAGTEAREESVERLPGNN